MMEDEYLPQCVEGNCESATKTIWWWVVTVIYENRENDP